MTNTKVLVTPAENEVLAKLPDDASWQKLLGIIEICAARKTALDYASDALRQLASDIAADEAALMERQRVEPRYEWAGRGHATVEIKPPLKDEAAEARLESRIAAGRAELAQRGVTHAEREAEWRPLASLITSIVATL